MNKSDSITKTLLRLSIFGLMLVFGATRVQAAEGMLVTTSYTTFDQTDFVYENSVKVLADYSGDEVNKPIIVNLVTQDQKMRLEENGHTVTIIDANPDLTTYKMFYMVQPEQLPKMDAFGKVYPLARNHVLVKITNAKPTFADGVAPAVMPEPFLDIAVAPHASGTPSKRLPVIDRFTPMVDVSSSNILGKVAAIGLILAGIIVCAGGIGYYLWRQKQQPPIPEQPEQPITELPPEV